MKCLRAIKRIGCKIVNSFQFRKQGVVYGSNFRVNGVLKFYGKKRTVCFGDNVIINSGKHLVPIGFDGESTFWTLKDGKIIVGDSCGFTNVAICSAEKVEIGNYVLLGGGVKIYDTDFHSLDYLTRRNIDNDPDRKSKAVIIKDDVFVGAGTIILKGAVIGEQSIIGAGSVVRGEIPPRQIWAGNPAVFIRNID